MPYYVFSIGGTGARCLESLIYLCAMGIHLDQPLFPIFVDPDQSNGNITRTLELLRRYKDIHNSVMKFDNTNYFFNTEIIYNDNQNNQDDQIHHFYNPNIFLNPNQRQLLDFIGYDTFLTVSDNNNYKYLAELLFGPKELHMDMDQGYRGVPSIGSMLMAEIENLNIWDALTKDLEAHEESKVFIFSSLFGGTGASGFPVISQLIKDKVMKAKVGGALLLPYFKLKDPATVKEYEKEYSRGEILPDSNRFLVNAKIACEYYQNNYQKTDAIYLLGEDFAHCPTYEIYAIGGEKQKNPAHMLELMAAFAAIDFFKKKDFNRINVIKVESSSNSENDGSLNIKASDLPYENSDVYFERFALLYHYIEELFVLIDEGKEGVLDKIAWLRDLRINDQNLRGKVLIEGKDKLLPLKEVLDTFKIWIYQNHTNTPQLKILDMNLALDRLMIDNPIKYKNYHISHLDTKLYNKTTGQDNLLGALIEIMSKALNIEQKEQKEGENVTLFIAEL